MYLNVKVVPLTEELYSVFYSILLNSRYGNLMLPSCYTSVLWGDVVLLENNVIGGWIGLVKGNLPIMKNIAKSIYFDSYPIFSNAEYEKLYMDILVNAVKDHAKQDKVVMLNLTHWVRGNNLKVCEKEICATFTMSLHNTEDELWKKVESKQRNCVRKGEKLGVEVLICNDNESLVYLEDFQRLRRQTQQKAINKNNKASMLLKSDDYFRNLFLNSNVTLFVGKVEEKVATVALMIKSGNTVYYYSGGSDYELNKKYASSAWVIWNAIKYYNGLGLDVFDMGGCPSTPAKDHPAYGVYAFKRSFGGDYMEFDGGKIIISNCRYRLLKFILSQRRLLRLFSTKF